MPKGHYPRKPRFYPLDPDLPIDAAATEQRLGYAATTVSPGATKKVSCRCTKCGVLFDRVRHRVKADAVCASCAHTKGGKPAAFPRGEGYEKVEATCAECQEPFLVRRMSLKGTVKCARCRRKQAPVHNAHIDVDATARQFGYDVTTLSAKSFKKVVVRCASCAGTFTRIRRNVVASPVCPACANGNPPEDNAYIDDAETLKRFGYCGTTLSRRSRRKVVVRCSTCDTLFERARGNVDAVPVCTECRYPPARNEHVDVAETLKRFGYDPTTLAQSSSKHIVFRCTACGVFVERRLRSLGPAPVCLSCRFPTENHPALDDEETLKRYGYKASDVPCKSARRVVGRCVKCGDLFDRARHNVSAQPVCCPCTYFVPPMNNVYGRAESTLKARLEDLCGRELVAQYRLANHKYLDIYDPVTHTGVEYCGLFWHNELSPQPRDRTYHYDKYQACLQEGVSLVTVFEDEWCKNERAVLNTLAVKLNIRGRTYGARKCQVAKVPWEEAKSFFNEHHVQGAPPHGWVAWGLYAPDKTLLACMLFGAHHRQGHEHTAVLSRFCSVPRVHVAGGASRLLKAALPDLRDRACSQVVSWSDNRWFTGDVYRQMGFELVQELPPDYTYVVATKPVARLSKQSQRKKVTGCPPGKTEHQWALERGLARVWDCGKKRWVREL